MELLTLNVIPSNQSKKYNLNLSFPEEALKIYILLKKNPSKR